ncbi:Crp/Fnr family transcriptional regulator [Roseomonas sp. NAR14]|uniref:Crp/Fnr family transcriptional regulator n=1 Tax=Roseomonas acroporae TaxID=2937791 RepID=A0A9X1Y2U0_9PROT|nr:Crp/Fnr family transcriptional regulator [Roseomonas acroporae]MCK8782904.1 Crp/Fnr family transcriptional regulator [Roseomonas acroporae]
MGCNQILAVLPPVVQEHLAPWFKPVELITGALIHADGDRIESVLFVDSGMVSLVLAPDGDAAAEVGIVGNEGMVGLGGMFDGVSKVEAVVQIAGTGRRLPTERLRSAMAAFPAFADLMHRYLFLRLLQTEVGMACNALHSVEQRAARWLLMTVDRVGASFSLKQDFLAQMLGVRRASISGVANSMQKAGLIRYRRGAMTVTDLAGLEALACGCRNRAVAAHRRLLGPAPLVCAPA